MSFPLNKQQRQAATHIDGPCLVLAGAGSGKTRVIIERICHLINSAEVPARAILAMTFTNKAAKEMRERVNLSIEKRKTKGLFVSTFHSFCVSMLKEEIERLGYKKNFTIYGTADQLRLIKDLAKDNGLYQDRFDPAPIQWQISDAKNSLISYQDYRPSFGEDGLMTSKLYPLYQKALKNYNAIDFDDIIMLCAQILTEFPEVKQTYAERFRYVMVDEYQDTNAAQYRLIRLLTGEHRNIFVVGDDDQSIYGWRGADLGNILNFEEDFPGTRTVRLEQNYRSTGTILKAANAVILHNKKRKEKELWTSSGDGEKIVYSTWSDDEEEAASVAAQIHALRHRHNHELADFAILYRTNSQSRAFEEQLRYENIPYVLVGGQKFFDRKEVKDALAYLKVLVNPADEINLLRIINYPKRGIGESTIQGLIARSSTEQRSLWEILWEIAHDEEESDRASQAIRTFVELLSSYRSRFSTTDNLSATAADFIQDIDLRGEIYRGADDPQKGKRRVENLEEVVNALASFQERETQGGLHRFVESVSLLDDSDKPRNDKDKKVAENAVTLMSLHSSKGLEFPVVFLVGFEEDFIPHKKSVTEIFDVDEERRLLYVGITRAQKLLYLFNTSRRKKYGQMFPRIASRFLEEIPEELLEQTNTEKSKPSDAKSFFSNIANMLEEDQ